MPASRFRIRGTEDARLVEIVSRQLQHQTVAGREHGFRLGKRLREMGENGFPIRQGDPVKNGVQVFQNYPGGVNRGIWHGAGEFQPGTRPWTSPARRQIAARSK